MHDKFVVINRSGSVLQLEIPAPAGSGRFSASVSLDPSMTVDLVPFAGSKANCKLIPSVIQFLSRGALQLIED